MAASGRKRMLWRCAMAGMFGYVIVADHRIGDGVARTMKAVQDAAVYPAKQHNVRNGTAQLGPFLTKMGLAFGLLQEPTTFYPH